MVNLQAEFPADFAENFEEIFPEHDSVDDVLQYQEIVYESLQASSLNNRNSDSDHWDHEFRYSEEGQSSNANCADLQLALDEAYARSLMIEEVFMNLSTSEPTVTVEGGGTEGTGNVEDHSAETSAAAVNQDDINPDNMTYEELETLGESIGVESKGLSVEQIARLSYFRFREKKGLFSNKKTNKECVICCMQYKDNEKLTALSCRHDYHKDCIARWLRVRKNCPVCQREVE